MENSQSVRLHLGYSVGLLAFAGQSPQRRTMVTQAFHVLIQTQANNENSFWLGLQALSKLVGFPLQSAAQFCNFLMGRRNELAQEWKSNQHYVACTSCEIKVRAFGCQI